MTSWQSSNYVPCSWHVIACQK
ncbi:hypothetical protein AB0X45_03925 [Limosilactobacillus reuteri]